MTSFVQFFQRLRQSFWTVKVVPRAARTVTVWRISLMHLLTAVTSLFLLVSTIWGVVSQRTKQELARLRQLRQTVVEQGKAINQLHSQREEMKNLLTEATKKIEHRHARLQRESKEIRRLINEENSAGKPLSIEKQGVDNAANRMIALHQYSLKSSRGNMFSISALRQKIRRLNKSSEIEEHKIKTTLERIPSLWPVSGAVASYFGFRTHPVTGSYQFHNGVDIVADYSTAIKAAASGVVAKAGWEGGYGNFIEIDHGNGLVSKYAHCSQILMSIGSTVKKGQVIALVGSSGLTTGPHLHYEVQRDGKVVNPMSYLDFTTRLLAEADITKR